VTLAIPDYNDSDEELAQMAEFIASVSVDIPWHVTAFHPDYKMKNVERTPAKTLSRARRLGKEAGLRYIYSGNLPGQVGSSENTFCPKCGALVIEREGHNMLCNLLNNGACPQCQEPIPGRWQ
jgi:pyruvate formate lyase activating enzyme